MDDIRVGAALRALRLRARRTQIEVAARAGVSDTTVSRLERGHAATLPLSTVRAIASALDARAELDVRWRGGELLRLLDERHATLQSAVLARLASGAGWQALPEATFSVFGERGSIDVLAWHVARRALLIVEVKSTLADCQDLLRTMDQRRRLAPRVAGAHGWRPATVSRWVVIEETDANRHRVRRHAGLLRAAFPADWTTVRRWLADPVGTVDALSFVDVSHARNGNGRLGPPERLGPRRSRSAERAAASVTGDSS